MNIITVSRNTYEWRNELKAAGFKWNPQAKSWTGDADKVSLDFQRDAILKLADAAPNSSAYMATRNGPGHNEIDNKHL